MLLIDMGKVVGKQKALYKRITAILWEDWDPIGVNDGKNKWDDEYDCYVSHIFRLAIEGADAVRIAGSLSSSIQQNMGLSVDKERNLIVAKIICRARAEILG